MANIAFIGLGNMGGPMAANLVKAGHKVQGFDLVPASCESAKADGVTIAPTPGVTSLTMVSEPGDYIGQGLTYSFSPQTGTFLANRNFDNVAESMGGLYAFEAQQPHTSTSKLKGLQDHYQQLPIEAHPYFAVHCDDVHEMALLAERIQALPLEEQEKAIAACREVADALWNALSGICHVHKISC